MIKKYFGTDGIRGTFGQFPITENFFFKLALSIKKTRSNISKIIIGKDTRKSCDQIESALISGFSKENIKCDSCGIVSTPILSFNTRNFDYDLGIMISASHNPYNDNGIKIFKKNGEKLTDNDEIEIEKNIDLDDKGLPSSIENKAISKIVLENYENELISKFSKLSDFKQKITLDCANGSLSKIAPKVLKELQLNFINYASEPNGININENCGAMHPTRLSSNTLHYNSDIGISFDGDADRVVFCDEKGNIVDGDYILAILSRNLKENDLLINNLVVSTKMSNLGLRSYLENNKIDYILSDVGDRYVIEMMKKKNSSIGGEQSGHIILSNNSYCGDGLLTALQILEILNQQKCKLSELCNDLFIKVPQRLVNIKMNKDSNQVLEDSKIINYLSDKLILKDSDILLRKSGTENLLRLMVQSKSKEKMNSIINDLVEMIKGIDEK